MAISLRKPGVWGVAAIVALVAAGAGSGCSSSGGGGANSACLTSEVGASCYSCGQSKCAPQLSTFNSSCTDYVGCFCPNGAFDMTAHDSQTCQGKLTGNASCESANQALVGCATSNCPTECGNVGSSSGGSSSGGSSGTSSGSTSSGSSGSSSSGGTGNYTACGISSINAQSCADCITSMCCAVTMTCANDAACKSVVTCISNCTVGDSTCTDACVSPASTAVQTELTNMSNCWANTCGTQGC